MLPTPGFATGALATSTPATHHYQANMGLATGLNPRTFNLGQKEISRPSLAVRGNPFLQKTIPENTKEGNNNPSAQNAPQLSN